MPERYPFPCLDIVALVVVGGWILLVAGCSSLPPDDSAPNEEFASPGDERPSEQQCSIPVAHIFEGCRGKDCIPALTDPPLVVADAVDELSYLKEDDRVIGLEIDGRAIAVPIPVMREHEVANFHFRDKTLAVTYCPLTGSSLAFDVSATLGVSGLLYKNNLILYDRRTSESLWVQMQQQAVCGPRTGQPLSRYPILEMTWAGWKELHPNAHVVSKDTGFERNYAVNQYSNYEMREEISFPMPEPLDHRRPVKELVLGIPGDEGMAFPFGALDAEAPVHAVDATVDDEPVVVLWNRAREAAAAFYATHEGQRLHFEARDGRIVDTETSSSWRVDGVAVSGPLAGARLDPVLEAYVAYWFAWAAFHPETQVWTGGM